MGVRHGCVSARGREQRLLTTFEEIDENPLVLTHQVPQTPHLELPQRAKTADDAPLQILFGGDPARLALYLLCMVCNMTSLMSPCSVSFVYYRKLFAIVVRKQYQERDVSVVLIAQLFLKGGLARTG